MHYSDSMVFRRNQHVRSSPSWEELQLTDDDELMVQLSAGHDDALAVIVDRYQRLVLSVALRIVKDQAEAEDVVQTVFVDFLKDIERFDPARGTLKVWLLQYAYSRSINRRRYLEHRHFYSRLDVEQIDSMHPVTGPVGIGGLSSSETARLVRQAIGALNEGQQRAIELVYFEGLTLVEAAQKTGETVPAIRHQYYRGLMKLREFISSSRAESAPDPLRADGMRLGIQNAKPRPV
jgi:RNA polymerase sigma-70 factor (ECF subfamily)